MLYNIRKKNKISYEQNHVILCFAYIKSNSNNMETKENNVYLADEKFSENSLLGFVPDSALIDDSLIRNQSCNDIPYSAYVEFIY